MYIFLYVKYILRIRIYVENIDIFGYRSISEKYPNIIINS